MGRIILRVRSDHGDCNVPEPPGATGDEDGTATADGNVTRRQRIEWRGVTLYIHSTHVPHCTIARV